MWDSCEVKNNDERGVVDGSHGTDARMIIVACLYAIIYYLLRFPEKEVSIPKFDDYLVSRDTDRY